MTTSEYITITAFARLCGVSAKTLRFYGDIGLFRPAFTEPRTRYRFYVQEQLRDFVQIQSMRDCGASLAEIRAALRASRSPAGRGVVCGACSGTVVPMQVSSKGSRSSK